MFIILFWIFIFVISLATIIKAADYFTDSAEKLGELLNMSSFIIGITIVAIGTSLPELAVSIVAVIQKTTEIVPANVIGSNLFNVLMIIGIGSIITARIKIKRDFSVAMVFLSTFYLLYVFIDGKFTFFEALIGLFGYLIYIFFASELRDRGVFNMQRWFHRPQLPNWQSHSTRLIFNLFISIIFIYLGAKFTVDSLIELADLLNIGASVIAVTAVAIGTSLPELGVVFATLKRKNYELIVGNVVGSNIFNAFVVLAVPGLISTINIDRPIFNIGLPFLLVATLLYVVFAATHKNLSRWTGVLFVLVYVITAIKLYIQ
ncbi:calcium/sodium antiporter [Patescibacteria group bacterium]